MPLSPAVTVGSAGAAFVVEDNCAYKVTQTFYWDVPALPTVTAGESGIEYSLASVFRDRESGLYSCILEKRERITQSIALYVTEQGAAEEISEQQFLGVRTDDKDDTGAAVALQDMTLEAGKIKIRRRSKNKDCTQDIVEQSRAGQLQTVTHDSESRADQTASTAWARNAAAKADAAAVAGKIVRATSRENEFGKFDNTVETITPVAQTVTHTSESRADQTAETAWARNAAAKADATAVAGKIVRATSRENEFGLFDNTVETIEPVNQAATGGETRADMTRASASATQADTEASATRSAGEITAAAIVRADNRPTPFGKYATERMVETPLKLVKTFAVDTNEKLTVFQNHTVAEVNALLGSTDVVPTSWTAGLSISPTGYLVSSGECLWTGTIRAVSRVRTLRPKWEGFSETGITESSFVIREFDRKLYKVVQTITFNHVGDFDIDDGLAAYNALHPQDGSWFRNHDSQNFYIYKAVTAVKVQATDITSAFEAGTEITI